MNRRYWPGALAVLALILFGSYLFSTHLLVRQIRHQSQILSGMYAAVQRGLVSVDENAQMEALWDLQTNVLELGVPLIVTDAQGRIVGAHNLPFEDGLDSPRGRALVQRYAAELHARGRYVNTP